MVRNPSPYQIVIYKPSRETIFTLHGIQRSSTLKGETELGVRLFFPKYVFPQMKFPDF